MDASPLVGTEERKVRAARRFGLIGLVITVCWLLVVPAFAVLVSGPAIVATAWPLFVLYVAAVGLHLWRIREHTRSLGRRAPVWFMVVAPAVALALILVGLSTSYVGYVWALVSGVLLGDVVGGLRARWIALWVILSTTTVVGLGYLVNSGAGYPEPWMVWVPTLSAGFFVASMWPLDVERLWWLKAVTDMDDSRRAAAELATARERLRLADDLHDILGHALEVVAFKSELATRLLDVDAARARREMEEVQRVARESLGEVRALVRETRSIDLVSELAGARAVLESAGIALQVRGDATPLGAGARTVLGRVLREAMTNLLRHAQPSHCAITIEVVDGVARLEVVNDGALPADDADPGTGLVALARYLDEHAGTLDAGRTGDGRFRLDAVLPGAGR